MKLISAQESQRSGSFTEEKQPSVLRPHAGFTRQFPVWKERVSADHNYTRMHKAASLSNTRVSAPRQNFFTHVDDPPKI